MNDECPLDAELERLLTRTAEDAERQAFESHIAGCAECRRRIAQLSRGGVTLPPQPADAFKINVKIRNAADRPQGRDASSESIPAAKAEVVRAPPAAFGRYTVKRTLGSGGFGDVYLGHDTQLDRPVAIKVMRADSASQFDRDRFLQEAKRLARLRHPGIVTVHDVGIHERQVYVVSDFLDGPDLGAWLKDHRPLWPESARIAAAIADALAHAHAQLIVHRDVKPANIILTADRAPVLVDFGLALDEEQSGGAERGTISGTPLYMSPEQAGGSAHRIDGRTDIYSTGVVLYQMLTGRTPFRSKVPMELLRQVCEDEPQPPRQLVRDIPSELERVCLKAMSKRQQDRYTTADDFAADLRRVLQAPSDVSISRPVSIEMPSAPSPSATSATHRVDSLRQPSSHSRAREAERRQVTVLVCGCDLFESDAYLGADVEEQARVLRVFTETCEDAVRQFSGTVVQCNDQGLVACFGFPVAFEDAAGRAARTGLALLESMKSAGEAIRREKNLELNPWVGIHTGPAIVESKEGAVALVGEARNVAVRLKEVAVAGQVICTDASHRLFQGRFQCDALGGQKIKGITQPVELFRVDRIAVYGNLMDAAAPSELSPLTARDQEVGLLKDRWEQAREGTGQVVLLVGDPGLGKSRLVHTMKQHVLGQIVEGELDAPVIEWRCSPHFQNTELYPAIDFYERIIGVGREESPQARFDRLLQRLEEYGLARPQTVPLFASLLSLPIPDRFPPLSLSPVRQREETFRVLLEWLHTRASRKPVLFVLEDLHWVDASTLEFLGQFLAESLQDSILTLLTFRPEFKPPWAAVAHQTSLALNRFTRRQVGELMREKTHLPVPEVLIEQVYDRTGGVPLFVEEFTKMVQESGVWTKGSTGDTSTLLKRAIPATLQDLVMARLDRMEGDREVAQLAATLGREFDHELLAAVATLDVETLQGELAKLVQADILYPKGRPPRCSYTFKHALLEDALYNSLVTSKRQQFHRRIAEVLEAQFPQTAETRPELLAHHFTEAGLTEKATAFWLKAGLRSRERSAFHEAIGHLNKGLTLLRTLAESRQRDDQELQFLTALGPAYITARGYAAPEVGPTLLRARELCERIDNPQQLLGIMLGMWEWRIVRSDLRLCEELASDGMALADRMNDPGMRMEALFMPGVTSFYRGQFASARTHFENALANYDDQERTKVWSAHTGHNASVTHRCYLALVLWHLGYPDQAIKLDRETCELARRIGHAFSLGHAVDFSAFLHCYSRIGAGVEQAAKEEITIGTDQGFHLWSALGALHRAAGMLLQGQRDEATPLLLRGLVDFRATGAEVRVPSYLSMLGEAYTQSARFEDAHKVISEGLAIAAKNDDRCHEPELYRLKGELLLADSRDEAAAEECFRKAIEIAQRQQSRAWELRATMSLARLWQQKGRRNDARAALAAVFDTYTEGFTTPDLADAASLLNALA